MATVCVCVCVCVIERVFVKGGGITSKDSKQKMDWVRVSAGEQWCKRRGRKKTWKKKQNQTKMWWVDNKLPFLKTLQDANFPFFFVLLHLWRSQCSSDFLPSLSFLRSGAAAVAVGSLRCVWVCDFLALQTQFNPTIRAGGPDQIKQSTAITRKQRRGNPCSLSNTHTQARRRGTSQFNRVFNPLREALLTKWYKFLTKGP